MKKDELYKIIYFKKKIIHNFFKNNLQFSVSIQKDLKITFIQIQNKNYKKKKNLSPYISQIKSLIFIK
jgi:hypothetical protein